MSVVIHPSISSQFREDFQNPIDFSLVYASIFEPPCLTAPETKVNGETLVFSWR